MLKKFRSKLRWKIFLLEDKLLNKIEDLIYDETRDDVESKLSKLEIENEELKDYIYYLEEKGE